MKPLLLLLSLLSCAFASPSITTEPATEIGDLSAKLHGTINVDSVGLWLVEFEYGQSIAQNPATIAPSEQYFIQGSTAGNQTISLSSPKLTLLPGTSYQFRFTARNTSTSEVLHGNTLTFTTLTEEDGGTLPTAISFVLGNPPPVSHKDARLTARVFSGSSPTKIFVRYGTDFPLKNQASVPDLLPTNTTREFTVVVKNLQPTTQYHYQWFVTNSLGSSYSVSRSFTTGIAPSPITHAASEIRSNSATLRATVDLNGNSTSAVTFEYGETIGYGSVTPAAVSPTSPASFSGAISGLRPATIYHYRVRVSLNDSTSFEYGADATFTTNSAGEAPSFTSTPTVADLNISSATPTVPSFFSGTSDTRLALDYGTSPDFSEAESNNYPYPAFTTHSNANYPLTNLQPDTLYHFRFRLSNESGNAETATATFRTPRAPIVTTDPTTNITDIRASPTGTFDLAPGSTIRPGIEYGETTTYGKKTGLSNEISATGPTSRSFLIDTTPYTTYHYRAFAFDGVRYYYGEDRTFTATAPSTPPEISDPKVATAVFGAFGQSRPHISADSARLQAFFYTGGSPATLEFEYGITPQLGQVKIAAHPDRNYYYERVATELPELEPDTKYYWRARASSASGTVVGQTFSFRTLPAPLVTTRPAISITDSSATVVGGITPNKWEYDLEIAYGTDESMPFIASQITPPWVDGLMNGTPDLSNRNVTASVSGLLPDTTYYYQLRAKAEATFYGGLYSGEIHTFTTGPASTPPSIRWCLAPIRPDGNHGETQTGKFPRGQLHKHCDHRIRDEHRLRTDSRSSRDLSHLGLGFP